MTEKDQI